MKRTVVRAAGAVDALALVLTAAGCSGPGKGAAACGTSSITFP
ncbi:hypothetical protein [Streptomyces sp. NPDC051286]